MSVPISQALRQRIRRSSLLSKVCRPEDLVPFFKDGMYMGWSGTFSLSHSHSLTNNDVTPPLTLVVCVLTFDFVVV